MMRQETSVRGWSDMKLRCLKAAARMNQRQSEITREVVASSDNKRLHYWFTLNRVCRRHFPFQISCDLRQLRRKVSIGSSTMPSSPSSSEFHNRARPRFSLRQLRSKPKIPRTRLHQSLKTTRGEKRKSLKSLRSGFVCDWLATNFHVDFRNVLCLTYVKKFFLSLNAMQRPRSDNSLGKLPAETQSVNGTD